MKEPEPVAGQVPRGTSTRARRAASLGLAGVVVLLAVFSIVAAYTTRTQVDRARYYQNVHDSLTQKTRGPVKVAVAA